MKIFSGNLLSEKFSQPVEVKNDFCFFVYEDLKKSTPEINTGVVYLLASVDGKSFFYYQTIDPKKLFGKQRAVSFMLDLRKVKYIRLFNPGKKEIENIYCSLSY